MIKPETSAPAIELASSLELPLFELPFELLLELPFELLEPLFELPFELEAEVAAGDGCGFFFPEPAAEADGVGTASAPPLTATFTLILALAGAGSAVHRFFINQDFINTVRERTASRISAISVVRLIG